MTTARDLITDTYIELGQLDPNRDLDGKRAGWGLRVLNRMLASWAGESMLIPYTESENFSLDGSTSYTMGTSGTASSTRAKKVMNAFVRDSSGRDWPMKKIDQRKYNNIPDKDIAGRPEFFFYDPLYPVGYLYVYRAGGSDYTMYIESEKLLQSSLSLSTSLTLDSVYEDAIVNNLKIKLSGPHITITPLMIAEARRTKRVIKNLNAANRQETMDFPPGFDGGYHFHFFSGD